LRKLPLIEGLHGAFACDAARTGKISFGVTHVT
jgi:hypothetical protein